jgi:SAM-dependent methyltransferase
MMRRYISRFTRAKRVDTYKRKSDAELKFQERWQIYSKQQIDTNVKKYWLENRYLDRIMSSMDFSGKNILDIGCGVISALHIIDEGFKVGIDPLFYEYFIMYGKRIYKNICGLAAVGEKLPFKRGSFDVVICSNVLDHVVSPYDVISEVKRVLRPGGKFILTVDIYNTDKARGVAHPHTLTERDISDLLGEFSIKWSMKSGLRAQVARYFDNKTVPSDEAAERIVLAERV